MEESVQAFFQANQQILEDHYPGINFQSFLSYTERIDNWIDHIDEFKKGVPLDYIVRSRYFYNAEFYVDERVLIPRFETEILVDEGIKLIKKHHYKKIADICCGSGCVGLALAIELDDLEIDLTDISEDALSVTKLNRDKLQYLLKNNEIAIKQADRMPSNSKYDLILTNPPYIKEKNDLNRVHKNVNQYEPHISLYLDDGEYDQWFKDFFGAIHNALNRNGTFIMEGSEEHLERLVNYCHNFDNVELLKDLTGRPRFIRGVKCG